jgi:hypothetical protein
VQQAIQGNSGQVPSEAEAREYIAKARRLLTGTPTISLLDETSWHLKAIPPGSSQYKEAQTLLKAVSEKEDRLQREAARWVEKQRQVNEKKAMEDLEPLRISFAKELEDTELQEGVDMTVLAEGPKHTTLRISYTLMSRPLEYQYVHNEKFMTELYGARFKKLVFCNDLSTDSYYHVYNLEK